MPSRICSILDCGRVHYAKGLCERHYRSEARRKRKAATLGWTRTSYLSVARIAGNAISKVAEFPGSAGDQAGVDRPRTSLVPLLSRGGGAFHLLGLVLGLSGTGPSPAPSAAFGGFRWR